VDDAITASECKATTLLSKNASNKDHDPTNMQQVSEQSSHMPHALGKGSCGAGRSSGRGYVCNPTKADNCSRWLFSLLPGVLIGCITLIPNRMVLIPGLVIGCITFAPNLMLSDAGTKQAKFAATIGLLASGMFVLAGVMGAILKTWKLYPLAVLLQLIALLTLSK
jgi:hypothetical protein